MGHKNSLNTQIMTFADIHTYTQLLLYINHHHRHHHHHHHHHHPHHLDHDKDHGKGRLTLPPPRRTPRQTWWRWRSGGRPATRSPINIWSIYISISVFTYNQYMIIWYMIWFRIIMVIVNSNEWGQGIHTRWDSGAWSS